MFCSRHLIEIHFKYDALTDKLQNHMNCVESSFLSDIKDSEMIEKVYWMISIAAGHSMAEPSITVFIEKGAVQY